MLKKVSLSRVWVKICNVVRRVKIAPIAFYLGYYCHAVSDAGQGLQFVVSTCDVFELCQQICQQSVIADSCQHVADGCQQMRITTAEKSIFTFCTVGRYIHYNPYLVVQYRYCKCTSCAPIHAPPTTPIRHPMVCVPPNELKGIGVVLWV